MAIFGAGLIYDPRTGRGMGGVTVAVKRPETGAAVSVATPVTTNVRGYYPRFETVGADADLEHVTLQVGDVAQDVVAVGSMLSVIDPGIEARVAALESDSGTSVTGSVATFADLPAPKAGKSFIVEDEVALYVADDTGGYRGPFPVQGEATDAAVRTAIAKPTVYDALTGNGKRPVGRGELVRSVKDYGAKGDGVTDDTAAIRTAIADTPEGGMLLFPVGYYKVSQQGTDPYLFRLNRAKRLVGQGSGSMILLDATIPATTDVFLIQPDVGSPSDGYGISGLHVAAQGSALNVARYAIHLDLTNEGARVSNSAFEDNILGPTGGVSFMLTNPVNFDGFWSSRIQGNKIWSGIYMERCGDSVKLIQNTIAGYGRVDIGMVDGSAGLILAYNNITCRGGIRIRSGHLIKILYNNLEVGYADATGSNGALLDIDGSQVPYSYGLLAVEVLGNNFGFRSTAPSGTIAALRINKSRSVLVEGNYISHKNAGHITITNQAAETIIGYNMYSPDIDPTITDSGARTVRKNVMRQTASGTREMWHHVAAAWRADVTEATTRSLTQVWDPKVLADVQSHVYRWDEANTFVPKHRIQTQRRASTGALDAVKTVASLGDGFLLFEPQTAVLTAANGSRWRLVVSSTGALSTVAL